MKQLTNYKRATGYLSKIFNAVNDRYFEGKLETPTITIQSTVGAYGHISVAPVWVANENSTHELNIGADYLNRPIENVVATMIHEACHLYAMMNGIKDTSNRGVYHNRRFKEIAEDMGHLIISKHEKYGWTITEPSEETMNFCIEYGFEDIIIHRETPFSFVPIGGGNAANGGTVIRPKKPSSSRKYVCPKCGMIVRATKTVNVMCGDCMETMIES